MRDDADKAEASGKKGQVEVKVEKTKVTFAQKEIEFVTGHRSRVTESLHG